jgi:hypothetical protein
MLTQRLANIIFTAILLIACGWFAWIAQGFEAAGLLASSGLPSKFFPQLLLAFIAVCALIIAYLYLFKGETGEDVHETVFANLGEARRGLLTMVVAVVCYFVWQHLGFVPMALAMGPLSLLAMGVRSIWQYVTVLMLTGFTYLVFTQLLNIQLV